MQDYKEIRRRFNAGESQRHIAKTLGISRNTVKKYCEGDAVPWERKTPDRQATVLTDDVIHFIQECLREDEKERLPKQRHTAKRIYDRLVEEKGFTGSETTVRKKVRELKGTLPQAFIPLQFDPGEAMQVDWGEARAYLDGSRQKVYLFCARLCYSCRPVVLAYRKQNEESFLDAFVRIFGQLGGTPQKVIFDNARVAVKEGFGAYAKKQAGYTALCSHYAFDAVFCNPAEGHEKGLVEGLVGWARRNILVPVPHVDSIEELNTELLKRCQLYEQHKIRGKPDTVGNMFQMECKSLNPLPNYPLSTAKCIEARVNAYSTVRFRKNNYSVPVKYAGCRVAVKGYPETIQIFYQGKLISEHSRCYGVEKTSYHLQDYLPLLEIRGRAILNAAPVRQTVPPEVMEELRANMGNQKKVREILMHAAETESSVSISNPVTVIPVDLKQYDALCEGKETKSHEL